MYPISISIITPIYNEEAILKEAILSNVREIEKYTNDFEIIIVNDGSSDGSQRIIDKEFGGRDPFITFSSDKNQGMGGAFKQGIKLSTKQHLLCVPADSPLNSETCGAFMEAIGKADVLVSYRVKRLGYSWWMRLNSKVFHVLVSKLFRMNLKDYNWIHLYDRKVFDEIEIQYNGLFMLAEVLIKAKRKGFSFHEFPVKQTQRVTGIASASKIRNVIITFGNIWAFFFRLRLKYE